MMRINAVLKEEMVAELDTMAREVHKSRSELLREAAEKLIGEHRKKQEEELRQARVLQALAAQDRLREKSGVWDGVAEVRKWREARK